MTLPFPVTFDDSNPVGGQDLQDALDLIAAQVTPLAGLMFVGTGSPNGAVTASPPALYLNLSGGAGTTLYVKESGAATNTGWVGK